MSKSKRGVKYWENYLIKQGVLVWEGEGDPDYEELEKEGYQVIAATGIFNDYTMVFLWHRDKGQMPPFVRTACSKFIDAAWDESLGLEKNFFD